ncbi:MAG TPA: glycosyltransferase family 4 protein [Sumerlaeia bacterium]|nr:glycosyltransferase family 4 protein [Sumerlaeia bacterium]
MKILQVASHRSIARGGAVQVYRLARELRRRGHDVTCVFHAPGGAPAARDAQTLEKVKEAGLRLLFYDMTSLRALLDFRRFLREERFDVIHSHRELALRFATFAMIVAPSPSVFVTNRGTTYRLRPFTLTRWLFRRRRLDRVVAVAQAVKDALVESGGLPPEKVDVIYGSVNPEDFDPDRFDSADARRACGIPPDARVVGTVASFAPKKGYEDFFRAAARLLGEMDRRPQSPPLRILAVGGRVEKKMGSLVDALGIRDRVVFAGHCEDVPAALAAMDVFVCASTKGEGLTGAVREALAMRRPVVSTNVSGNGEIVKDGQTGLLVPTRDPASLCRAVLRLLDDPEEARRLAQAGHDLAAREFPDAIRGDRIEALYAAIARQRSLDKGR